MNQTDQPTGGQPQDIQQLSPDKLMTRFRKSGIVLCVVAAFALHVVVLGGTSIDYIHGVFDPAWKAEQERLKKQADQRQADVERQAARKAARATSAPTTRAKAKAPAARPPDAAAAPPPGKKTPKELLEVPKPGETPPLPKGGISIDETENK